MKSLVSRSAIIVSTLLAGLIIFSATPSIADSPSSKFQSHTQDTGRVTVVFETADAARADEAKAAPNVKIEDSNSVAAASPYVATAYSLRGRTASGRMVSRGLI